MRVGLISDTHNFLDPRVPELFDGVDHILHAGDVGLPWVVMQLEKIAPVTAVNGNTDDGLAWREREIRELGGRRILVQHIVEPFNPIPQLRALLEQECIDIVVFGHTHRPFNKRVKRTLFVNPGYSGKPQFAQPRTLAVLHCSQSDLDVEFLPL